MKPYVLIIEDNFELRSLYADALSRAGLESLCTANGKEAFETLSLQPHLPALIVLDMIMPVMNGEAFLTELARCSEARAIPVIACSAVRPPSLPERVAFLRKPIELPAFIETIRQHLSPD